MAETNRSGFNELTLNLVRIVPGLLYWMHGLQKLFGVLGREEPVQLMTRYGAAGLIEMIGGALLVFGLFTRPVAFLLSGEMAFAYFLAHLPRGWYPIMNGGELPAVYAFLFLFIAANGGGRFSLDGWLKSRKS